MASTKDFTAFWSGQTLTAGAGDTTATAKDLTDGFGAGIAIKLTNGATGPTISAQVQVQVSQDNSEWYNHGAPIVGSVVNSAVVSKTVSVGIEWKHARLVAGSNTGQDVTVDADISEVTAIS